MIMVHSIFIADRIGIELVFGKENEKVTRISEKTTTS